MPKKSPRNSKSIKKHPRVLDTFITRWEKKLLLWMAARLPKWVSPDILTLLGLFGSIVIFVGYILTRLDHRFIWLATLGFIINWFGDSLDGTLARFRKIERPRYGFFIDHTLDAIGEAFIFVGLGLSPFVRFDLALAALASYLLGSIYVYLNTYINGVFRLSYGGLSPTEFRLIAILINTIVLFFGNPTIQIPTFGIFPNSFSVTIFELVVFGVMMAILYLFLFNTIRTAKQLAIEEKPK
jgi:phosphatidylglycerophosphate synthase